MRSSFEEGWLYGLRIIWMFVCCKSSGKTSGYRGGSPLCWIPEWRSFCAVYFS